MDESLLRWKDKETGELLSWKETLRAMANDYGTFCGRWHDNAFWARQKQEVDNMTEEQAKKRIIQIEQEANRSQYYWRMYQ